MSRDVVFREHIFPFAISKHVMTHVVHVMESDEVYTNTPFPVVVVPVNTSAKVDANTHSSSQPSQPIVWLSQSTRPSCLRAKLSDYVTNSESSHCHFNHTLKIREPKTFHVVIQDPMWRTTMHEELQVLQANKTWWYDSRLLWDENLSKLMLTVL